MLITHYKIVEIIEEYTKKVIWNAATLHELHCYIVICTIHYKFVLFLIRFTLIIHVRAQMNTFFFEVIELDMKCSERNSLLPF